MKDLREKFNDVQKMTFHNHLTIKTSTNQCVQIAETHAKDEAIGFDTWVFKNCNYSGESLAGLGNMFYFKTSYEYILQYPKTYSRPELYEIYQQQKEK